MRDGAGAARAPDCAVSGAGRSSGEDCVAVHNRSVHGSDDPCDGVRIRGDGGGFGADRSAAGDGRSDYDGSAGGDSVGNKGDGSDESVGR